MEWFIAYLVGIPLAAFIWGLTEEDTDDVDKYVLQISVGWPLLAPFALLYYSSRVGFWLRKRGK